MNRKSLSVTIITLNEAQNLPAAIESVRWADEVIVVDSGSTDQTCEIARSLGAVVVTHAWQGFGQQKNFAQSCATKDWVLNIDADERVSASLRQEIEVALTDVAAGRSEASGFSFPRRTYFLGQWIRYGGWYPNVLVRLSARSRGRWTEPAVHEELKIDGQVAQLQSPLDHYAFESIEEQVLTNLRYSRFGSRQLAQVGKRPRVARMILKMFGKFFETYLLKQGFRDGIAGLIISINAAHSMFLKNAYLFEEPIRRRGGRLS